MDRHVFPGHPVYQARAAQDLGLTASVAGSRPIEAVASIASLCAQAASADPADVPAILSAASVHFDRLRVASLAAELMLAEAGFVRTGSSPRPSRPAARVNPPRP